REEVTEDEGTMAVLKKVADARTPGGRVSAPAYRKKNPELSVAEAEKDLRFLISKGLLKIHSPQLELTNRALTLLEQASLSKPRSGSRLASKNISISRSGFPHHNEIVELSVGAA